MNSLGNIHTSVHRYQFLISRYSQFLRRVSFVCLHRPVFVIDIIDIDPASSQLISNPRGIRNNLQSSPLRNLRLQAQRSW
jgi:hypothetical protein